MRTRFWRKRDAKLDKRLNTVIETTERARKSIQLPPSRVTVDTSYPDMGAQEHDEGLFFDDGANGGAQQHFSRAAESVEAFPRDGVGEAEAHGDPASEMDGLGEWAGDDVGPADPLPDVSRWTLAGDAVEIERMRAALLARAEEAERALAAVYAAAEQQEQAARETYEAHQKEITARVAAETAHAEAARRADEVEAALIALVQSHEREAEASRDEAAGKLAASEAALEASRASVASQEARHRELLDALSREVEARRALEADLDAAIRKTEAAQSEVSALRQAAEAGVAVAHEGIAQERDVLLRRAEEAEMQLAALLRAAESREARLREAMDARQSEMAARQAAECERDDWARRAAETEAEVSNLKRALNVRPLKVSPYSPSSVGLVAQQPATPAAVVEVPSVSEDNAAEAETRADDALIKAALRSRLARKGLSAVEIPAEAEQPVHLPAVIERVQDVTPKDVEPTAGAAAQRRDRRVASQIPATLWREGMGQPLACTLKDRSSSGARLEFKHASMIEGFSAFNVGDRTTLTLNSAHEKTWVGCEVVWVDRNSCGVRFSGQFRSEGPAVRKSPRNVSAEKPQRAKTTRLASVFSLKGS